MVAGFRRRCRLTMDSLSLGHNFLIGTIPPELGRWSTSACRPYTWRLMEPTLYVLGGNDAVLGLRPVSLPVVRTRHAWSADLAAGNQPTMR